MNVEKICSRNVDRSEPGETVRVAAGRMRQRGVGSLVVVDEIGLPIGIVTDRDLAMRVVAEALDPGTTTVREVMTEGVQTVTEECSVEEAVERMERFGIRRLAVRDANGLLVGLLSIDDVLNHFAGEVVTLGRLIDAQRVAG